MGREKTILLVEDETIIAVTESRLLKKHGYEVIIAETGEKAVELVNSVPGISLILMDIDLGEGMDGTEAAEAILKDHDLPVAFLSSHTEPEVVEKTEGITSYGYIVKNSGETVLLASIKMAFRLFEAKTIYKDTFSHSINGICIHKMLRESEEKYRRLFETMSQGVVYQDNKGVIISANAAAERMLNLSFDQLRGRSSIDPRWKMITESGEQVSGLEHPVMVSLRTGQKTGPVTRGVFIPEKNEYVWLSITATPLFRAGEEKPFQAYATFDDISERVALEKELSREREFLEQITENMFDLVALTDLEGNYVFVAKSYQILGYDLSDLIGKNILEFVHPDDIRYVTAEFSTFLQSGKNRKIEYRYRCSYGSYLWFETLSKVIPDEGGNPWKILFSTRDITERKHAEKIIINQNQYLETILQTTADGFWVVDRNRNIIKVNDAYCKMTGYSQEEMLELSVNDLDVSEIPMETDKRIRRIMENTHEFFEAKHRRKDGTVFDAEISSTFLDIDGGQFICFCRDITERKQAEEALRKSEKKYKSIFENSLVSLWEEDISLVREEIKILKRKGVSDFRDYFLKHPDKVRELIHKVEVVNVNETGLKQYEAKTKDDVLGPLSKIFNYSEDSFHYFIEQLVAIAEGEKTLERETKVKTLEGNIVDMLMRAAIPSEREPWNNLLVAITDISDLKEKEKALKESQKALKTALESV